MKKEEVKELDVTSLNIFEKISLVSKEIGNLEKDMTVGKGNFAYKAVSDNQVTQFVKAAEQKYRLVSIPVDVELIEAKEVTTTNNKGEPVLNYTELIKLTLCIYNLDKDENITITSLGRGLDKGDKGLGKATTYARKYALLNAYKIATGEDLDAQKSLEQKPTTIDEKKVKVLNLLNEDMKLSLQVSNHFNIEDFNNLSDDNINLLYNNWKKKGVLND